MLTTQGILPRPAFGKEYIHQTNTLDIPYNILTYRIARLRALRIFGVEVFADLAHGVCHIPDSFLKGIQDMVPENF